VIATVRLALAAAVCHFIGRAYGDRALRWFTRYLGMSQQGVDRFEDQYRVAEWVLIPIFVGSNIVFVLSGTVQTRWRRILPLLLAGIAGRLALMWWLAKTFESESHEGALRDPPRVVGRHGFREPDSKLSAANGRSKFQLDRMERASEASERKRSKR
jgi:hypothetical protein